MLDLPIEKLSARSVPEAKLVSAARRPLAETVVLMHATWRYRHRSGPSYRSVLLANLVTAQTSPDTA